MSPGASKRSRDLKGGVDALDPTRHPEICRLLSQSSSDTCDLVPRGSNYTFLVKLSINGDRLGHGIYKPSKGERPLWDFPFGSLYKREYAAYLLSEALGWHIVPPTTLWEGPHGIGSLQMFINNEPGITYFQLRETNVPECKRVAAFDSMLNNADRKGGHTIKDLNGRVWSIDHGLSFNVEHKLRTVIWDFAGDAIAPESIQGIQRAHSSFDGPDGLAGVLHDVLDEVEIEALRQRMANLVEDPHLPYPTSRWDVPWPLV